MHFIRKDGRIIPIRDGGGGAKSAAKKALKVAKKITKAQKIVKPNQLLRATSVGLSFADGLTGLAVGHGIGASTLAGSVGFGLDAASVGIGAAAYAGKGQYRQRAKLIAKQEALNQAIGWGTYGATIIGRKAGRQAVVDSAKKGIQYASKILAFSRKALRVV